MTFEIECQNGYDIKLENVGAVQELAAVLWFIPPDGEALVFEGYEESLNTVIRKEYKVDDSRPLERRHVKKMQVPRE